MEVWLCFSDRNLQGHEADSNKWIPWNMLLLWLSLVHVPQTAHSVIYSHQKIFMTLQQDPNQLYADALIRRGRRKCLRLDIWQVWCCWQKLQISMSKDDPWNRSHSLVLDCLEMSEGIKSDHCRTERFLRLLLVIKKMKKCSEKLAAVWFVFSAFLFLALRSKISAGLRDCGEAASWVTKAKKSSEFLLVSNETFYSTLHANINTLNEQL